MKEIQRKTLSTPPPHALRYRLIQIFSGFKQFLAFAKIAGLFKYLTRLLRLNQIFFPAESVSQSALHVAGVHFVFRPTMNRTAGYTLVEILLTIGILSIISGIAYVSYQDQTLRTNKNDLKLHAELFASAVKNCITISGGWKITLLDSNTGIPDQANTATPCKAEGTPQKPLKDDLKEKLNFTCPAGAECQTHTEDANESTCLSITKKVSGKYLQVLSRVSYSNKYPSQIWCGTMTSESAYLTLNRLTCKKSPGWADQNKPLNSQGKRPRTTLKDKGFKQDNDCWK